MSLIFISHSSQDNVQADALVDWLQAKGQRSIFLDFDPAMGIPAGHEWEKELYQRLRQCQAVIVLCSQHSINSEWCFAEAMFAKALGKHIFPVSLDQTSPWPILSTFQVIDFTTSPEQGLKRLWRAMLLKGLDPKSIFDWDGSRPPYPGLPAFQEQDAAIFFGREQDIHEVIAELNLSRQLADTRMVVLEGISGSGKSSLLRAGVVPRLKNDPDSWLIINPFRVLNDPVHELTQVLKRALSNYAGDNDQLTDFEQILHAMMSLSDDDELLNRVARTLREVSLHRDATVVLIIDQFEELLGSDQNQQSQYFIKLLTNSLLAERCEFLLIVTLRADFRSALESHPDFSAMSFKTYPVMPMKIESYEEVIRGPAQLSGTELEPGLVNCIINDIDSSNALPLLAFTLRELWDRFGHDHKLTIDEYQDKLGGLHNSVAKVAESVLRAEALSSRQLKVLRDAFISLARINEEGQFVRQPQSMSSLDEQSHPVLEIFINKHLLVSRMDEQTSDAVIEVAHEALFRTWVRLKKWLDEERGFLEWRYRLQTEIVDWEHVEQDKGALLSGATLDEALSWIDKKPHQIKDAEKVFINKSQKHRSRLRKLVSAIGISTSMLIFISAIIAFVQRDQAIDARNLASNQLANNYLLNAIDERDNKENILKASHYFMHVAEVSQPLDGTAAENANLSAKFLNGNLRLENIFQGSPPQLNWFKFADSCPADALNVEYGPGEIKLPGRSIKLQHKQVRCAIFNPDRTKILSWGDDKYVRIWTDTGDPLLAIKHSNNVRGAIFNKDQTRVLSWSDNQQASLWDSRNGQRLSMPMHHEGPVRGAQFSPDERYIASWHTVKAKNDKEVQHVRIWETTALPTPTRFYTSNDATGLSEASDLLGVSGAHSGCRIINGKAHIPVAGAPKKLKIFKPASRIRGCEYHAASTKLLTWSFDAVISLWDTKSDTSLFEISAQSTFEGAAISDEAAIVLIWHSDGKLQIWNVAAGQPLVPPLKLNTKIIGVELSQARDKILVWDNTGMLNLWKIDPAPSLLATFDHFNIVKAIFSPDERYIASWSLQYLRIWDAENGYAMSPALGHQGYIENVIFDSNTKQLIVMMDTGVRVWNLPDSDTNNLQYSVLEQEVLTGTHLDLKSGQLVVLDKKAWELKKQAQFSGSQ